MSVQKIQSDFSISTICPLVVNNTLAILSFQTASAVASEHNVNSQFSSCHPDDYAYLQVWTAEQANQCCTTDLGIQNKSHNVLGGRY